MEIVIIIMLSVSILLNGVLAYFLYDFIMAQETKKKNKAALYRRLSRGE